MHKPLEKHAWSERRKLAEALGERQIMNIDDYLIDQRGKEWMVLLRDWAPPLPADFTLWLVNRFGDAFVVTEDGSVHMLDVGIGTFTRLADNRSHFADLLDVEDNGNNWLLIPLVDQCRKAGMTLGPNQCYGFKIPPVLGGKYEPSNFAPTDLAVHYSFLADIHKRVKDLPDGTPVDVVLKK
jgi:hypothetical protein